MFDYNGISSCTVIFCKNYRSACSRINAVACRNADIESIVAARRLRRSTYLGAVVCCIASTIGLLLTYYLTSVDAFGSLSPLNLLVYMLLWFIPVYLISDGAHRY